jgi:hypothetical protein
VSVDTTTVILDVETINIEEEEDDAKSCSAVSVPATDTPCKATVVDE